MTTTEAPAKTATIPAPLFLRAIKNALPFAAKTGEIPILNAVRIQADGAHITIDATDRYKLLRQELRADGITLEPFELTLADATRLHRELTGALRTIPTRARGGENVHVALSRTSDTFHAALWRGPTYTYPVAQFGDFPAIERILDARLEPTAEPVGFNADHLGAFGACRIDDDKKRYTPWCVLTYGNGKQISWTAQSNTGDHRLHGVLMSVRLADDGAVAA